PRAILRRSKRSPSERGHRRHDPADRARSDLVRPVLDSRGGRPPTRSLDLFAATRIARNPGFFESENWPSLADPPGSIAGARGSRRALRRHEFYPGFVSTCLSDIASPRHERAIHWGCAAG